MIQTLDRPTLSPLAQVDNENVPSLYMQIKDSAPPLLAGRYLRVLCDDERYVYGEALLYERTYAVVLSHSNVHSLPSKIQQSLHQAATSQTRHFWPLYQAGSAIHLHFMQLKRSIVDGHLVPLYRVKCFEEIDACFSSPLELYKARQRWNRLMRHLEALGRLEQRYFG